MNLAELEKKARTLECLQDFTAEGEEIIAFGSKFLTNLANGPGFLQGAVDPSGLAITEQGKELSEVLALFAAEALSAGLNPTSGKFMGYIPGGGVPYAAFGDFLAALTNRYAGVYAASPGAAEIENTVLAWLIAQLRLPDTAWGSLTSGGTNAILLCLIAARSALAFAKWPQAVIYFSEETHHCLQRSLIVAGQKYVNQRAIATNADLQIDVDALRAQIKQDRAAGLIPWLVVGNAGTVNTGAVDDLAALADVAGAEEMWFHVDACYGGAFAMLPNMRPVFSGIERADSIALDPHKGFFQPYGLGAAIVRQGQILKDELAYTADYLRDVEDHEHKSPADYSLELTRHFRGLRFWLALQRHGSATFFAAQQEKLLLARRLYEGLSRIEHLECGPPPNLSIVAFRLRDRDEAEQLQFREYLIDQGVLVSSTRLKGKYFLRACVLSFRTHLAEIEGLIASCQKY